MMFIITIVIIIVNDNHYILFVVVSSFAVLLLLSSNINWRHDGHVWNICWHELLLARDDIGTIWPILNCSKHMENLWSLWDIITSSLSPSVLLQIVLVSWTLLCFCLQCVVFHHMILYHMTDVRCYPHSQITHYHYYHYPHYRIVMLTMFRMAFYNVHIT